MHIVYLNPHAEDFIAKPLSFAIAKRRALTKYNYLLTGAINEFGKLDILVDGTISSLLPQRVFMWLPKPLRKILLNIELSFWTKLNKLENKVDIHWDTKRLDTSSALYLFSYKSCVAAFHERIKLIEEFNYKIINLSHYFIATKEKAYNISKLSNVILATESDIRNNEYYREFFKEDHPFIILPFEVGERFAVKKDWKERLSKCAATGSFHNLHEEKPQSRYQDFIKFYNMDSYHPLRKLIYRNKEALSDCMDIKISPYREKKKNLLQRSIARFFDTSQKKYFSFNIVDFYNSHKSALIGEEVHGLPAVGAFEAMACGCVLIAQEEYYIGLGLKKNVHFIQHEGNIESVRNTINDVNNNSDKYQLMSQNCVDYINKNCRSEQLWKNLQLKLKTLI